MPRNDMPVMKRARKGGTGVVSRWEVHVIHSGLALLSAKTQMQKAWIFRNSDTWKRANNILISFILTDLEVMINNLIANMKQNGPHLLSQCIFQLLLWTIQLSILYFTECFFFFLVIILVYPPLWFKFLIENPDSLRNTSHYGSNIGRP